MADWRKIRAAGYRSWLDGLPEEIYDKRETSHIVRLLDALCGENGVGMLRKRLVLRRLQTSLYETRYNDLDTVYSQIFSLPRLKSEQYPKSEDALLLWSEICSMDLKDAHYRNRIWNYMLSFQYGGTERGLQLAAQAATGLRCEVLDGMVYYRSTGVDEDAQGSFSPQSINHSESIDFGGVTILVDQEEPLTAEQEHNLSTVTSRLRPVDVRYTFMTRGELMERLQFTDKDDEVIRPEAVEESSHWWNVAKYVTGRPDWGLDARGNEWVEASVTKEAPQQLLVNSQESGCDYTPMIKDVTASSEHMGWYNADQRELFGTFSAPGAETLKGAANALSQASSRSAGYGYYGESLVIDGSYPDSYMGEVTPFYDESCRSHRYWSSEEREGDEWLVFELSRTVPVNKISFAVYRKPLRARVFLSSGRGEDGERVWVQARNLEGVDVTFTNREWGSTAGGELVAVDFDIACIPCEAVKITFERLDVPCYKQVSDDVYEERDFKWSVECADVSVGYVIKSEAEYLPTTYEDMFGNRVDTELRRMTMDRAVDDDPETYWISQPNVAETAVEYLVLKVADEPTRVNYVELDAIYAGCQMNVYSTDGAEPGNWTPYPQVYTLQSGRTQLPLRKVTYIKLEFTLLCATPYSLQFPDIPVVSRRYPWEVKQYAESRTTNTYEITRTQQLLLPPGSVGYDSGSMENSIGIDDIYLSADALGLVPADWTYGGYGMSGTTYELYRQYQGSSVDGYYGDDTSYESNDIPSPDAESFGGTSYYYRFQEPGEHEYQTETFYRTQELAYVVGLKDVRFGFEGRIFSASANPTYTLYMHDDRYIDQNDGWEHYSEERVRPASEDRLNYFETVELQSMYPFRTFEMAVNQKEPVEKFSHPSDMSREWVGYGTDASSVEMGLSGTVLKMNRAESGAGVESEPKLVRSMSIAKAQVDVYPTRTGRWMFECMDLFGEEVFNLYFDLEERKWQTVAATFVPTPGGSWWDVDYRYRVRIPLEGPLAKGSCVYVPIVEFDALREARMIDADFKNLRLVYFDGVNAEEVYVDITDNMELWFRLEQDIPSGKSANGEYDFATRTFFGSYYLYFGPLEAKDEPKRDYREVFDNGPYSVYVDVVWEELEPDSWEECEETNWEFESWHLAENGFEFLSGATRLEVEDEFFLPDKGFVSFEVTLFDGMEKYPRMTETVYAHTWEYYLGETWQEVGDRMWAAGGEPHVKFMMDYEDPWKRMQCYTYEGQMTFVIRDRNGFESAFVTDEEDLLQPGVKSNVLLEWDVPGTAEIIEAEFHTWGEWVVGEASGQQMLWQNLLAKIYHDWDMLVDGDGIPWQELYDDDAWDDVLREDDPTRTPQTWDQVKIRYDGEGLQMQRPAADQVRRWLCMWVDSAVPRRCTRNVYDERHFIEPDKYY